MRVELCAGIHLVCRFWWQPFLLSTLRKTMKTRPEKVQEVIYRGIWRGVGQIYNIKVENGYTTIIVKPGEDVRKRSTETQEKFASQTDARRAAV